MEMNIVVMGASNKIITTNTSWTDPKTGLPLAALAYIGDDVNDLGIMAAIAEQGLTAAPADALAEVLRRARLYFEAGVDCVYPISLRDPMLVSHVVKELGRPVNVNPSEPLAALAEAGAARISLGGGVHNWMIGEL